MTLKVAHALAPTFVHTHASPDMVVAPKDAAPVSVTVLDGSYRMCLAPSSQDFLRVLVSRINGALFTGGSATTCTGSLSDDGVFTLTFSPAVNTLTIDGVTARRLGLATSYIAQGVMTGAYPVWYLALCSAGTGGWWQPVQSGGAEQTAGGVVYGFMASQTSYTRELAVSWQPTSPDYRTSTGAEATPMFPGDAYLNSVGAVDTARMWSVLDVLYASRNALCGVAIGSWLTLKASTTDTLWQAYVAGEALLGVKVEPFSKEWPPWQTWKLPLVAPATGMRTTRG